MMFKFFVNIPFQALHCALYKYEKINKFQHKKKKMKSCKCYCQGLSQTSNLSSKTFIFKNGNALEQRLGYFISLLFIYLGILENISINFPYLKRQLLLRMYISIFHSALP